MLKRLYLLAPLPMVLWNSCDMRGPKGPKRCGGRPLASSKATKKVTNVPSTISPVNAPIPQRTVWQQVFVPTKQQHTKVIYPTDLSIQTADWSIFARLIGWNKNLQPHGSLGNQFDTPALQNKRPCHEIPWSLPISESSDSLSPDVVIPTAPVTELEAEYKIRVTFPKENIYSLYLICIS